MHKLLLTLAFAASTPFSANAETPKVEADIRPVAGLVAAVLGSAETTNTIIPPGASPHEFSIKPSTARRISSADAVFWVGPELSPWLKDTLATLAPTTSVQLHMGDGDHHEEDEKEDDHGHDDHAHDHHGEEDPHVWLNPETALNWINVIAKSLPDHAKDTAQIKTALTQTVKQLQTRLDAIKSRPYVVYHDGYAGFEEHFGLSHIAAITDGHAHKPGAAKRAELNTLIKKHSPPCLFIDTPNPSALATQIADEHNLKIHTLDTMGNDISLNTEFYPNLLTNLTDVIQSALASRFRPHLS